ncbi:MAG: Zn-dependent hydrolase [Gammaproteobacteria bacterium]|nr:Zn-dependent hydrolase [Gammaproteobacteria bacterium]
MGSPTGINAARLLSRLSALGAIGGLPGGGVCRLALTEEDKSARAHVIDLMRQLGLKVTVDQIGNVVGIRAGESNESPVLIGSHIDTVKTGGLYDGNLGVLAGLEVVECLNEHAMATRRPLGVCFFTNEEGARFAPDMMGSMVHQGHLDLDEMLSQCDSDGRSVSDALSAIGYAGDEPVNSLRASAFLELHIEQGPVLEEAGITIGAVESVQGISWTEVTIQGVSNHAGTTPMRLRHDAGYVASAIAVFVRDLALKMGGDQVGTVGLLEVEPNLVNVIARTGRLTVDLRNTDNAKLVQAEQALADYLQCIAVQEGVQIETKSLARFEPVEFAAELVDAVAATATRLGHSVRKMPSGAGHDAQAFAPNCPTAMIFVPSVRGISHNIEEFTAPKHIEAGANVLLELAMERANL